MIIWNKVTINDKELLDSYFAKNHYAPEFYNFTSVFIWSKVAQVEYSLVEGFFCMRELGILDQVYRYLMPLGSGDLRQVITLLKNDACEHGIKLYFEELSEDMIDAFNKAGIDYFTYQPRRDLYEYIYRVEDISNIKNYGSKKRALSIQRFQRTYNYTYKQITKSDIPKLIIFMRQWIEERGRQINDENNFLLLKADVNGVIAALENFERLNFFGAFLEVDEQIGALSFVTPLNRNTLSGNALMASNKKYTNISATMLYMLTKNECSDYEYINTAEDLGIESLRFFKSSFRPYILLPKYCTAIKNTSNQN